MTDWIGGSGPRGKVPIVVVLYYREEETQRMFKQLDRVTDNYELIIVNNGFDDRALLEQLDIRHYIENESNTGVIAAINQGLELVQGEYVAVLHSDLLIYEEGWLDHIIDFMEWRREVGLVGLAGRHMIRENGMPEWQTTVVNMRGYADVFIPTWKFTEVATIDGLGWVMRNKGLRLDESFGLMHFYDLDLSLQYVDIGDKVYVAAVDIWHIAEEALKSSRASSAYLGAIGKDDEAYYDEVREKFRRKWQHLLPLWRGYRDEAYGYFLMKEQDRIAAYMKEVLTPYCRELEAEWQAKSDYIELLEREIDTLVSRVQACEVENIHAAESSLPHKRFIHFNPLALFTRCRGKLNSGEDQPPPPTQKTPP